MQSFKNRQTLEQFFEPLYEASHASINCFCCNSGTGNLNVEYILIFILCSCIGASADLMTGDLLMETGHLKSSTVQLCSHLGSGLVVMRFRMRMIAKMRRMNGSWRLSLGRMGMLFYPSSCLCFDTGFRKQASCHSIPHSPWIYS